jgi:hypothetical protein
MFNFSLQDLNILWNITPVLVFQSLSPLIWPSGLPSGITFGCALEWENIWIGVQASMVGHIPRRGEWAGGHARWWQHLLADKDLFFIFLLYNLIMKALDSSLLILFFERAFLVVL